MDQLPGPTDQFPALAVAAVLTAAISAAIAKFLRLPWWALVLSAIVAWFGMALQLAVWTPPQGRLWVTVLQLTPLPSLFGAAYAVITRGMIGPPEGPLPRSR
jgi:hypothetical protein